MIDKIKLPDENGRTKDSPVSRKCKYGCSKLDSFDWLSKLVDLNLVRIPEVVEVRFKNTRKTFFRNPNKLKLEIGDPVVVESSTGYDIGHVSLVSELVLRKMMAMNIDKDSDNVLNIIRKPNSNDIRYWDEAKSLEPETLIKSRKIAKELNLEMKIDDVEYQGDKRKATFFYTAEGRVDFRKLIKKFASTFKIKVEMRQIGIRQEAGRVGGIADCGRELCCSSWLTDFNTVPTVAAKQQNLYLNPAKLSGQCSRLKCCLNYEVDTYLEAIDKFPDESIVLKTKKGNARVIKIDILRGIMWFLIEGESIETSPQALPLSKIKKVIGMNKRNILPPDLTEFAVSLETSGQNKLDQIDKDLSK